MLLYFSVSFVTEADDNVLTHGGEADDNARTHGGLKNVHSCNTTDRIPCSDFLQKNFQELCKSLFILLYTVVLSSNLHDRHAR